jgi:PAS domain S-box-containing protein
LIETLPIGYVRTSFDDEFLDMNSTFVDMLDGNSSDEIQSHGVTEFYRDQMTRDRLLDTLREEGQVNGEELKATTLSGDTIWISITGRLIDDDTAPHVDALVQYITDRKRRERRLQSQLDQFEHFGTVLSHDLQTPLRTAEGQIELARETEEIEPLDQAKAAVEQLEILIDDLATVMREGELVDDVTTFDIEECVQDIWNALPTENTTLQIRETVEIRGDKNAVIRLLENFLKNALDHGGDTVTVGILSDGFYLEDNGPGIPEDIREEIFEVGYSRKGSDEGTGVGLASARQIALAHGWEISATKGSNGGARFEIADVEFNG